MTDLDAFEKFFVAAMEAQGFGGRPRAVIRAEERLAVALRRLLARQHITRCQKRVHGKLRLRREKPRVREPCKRLEAHVAKRLRPKRFSDLLRRLHDGEKLLDFLLQGEVRGEECGAYETRTQVPWLALFGTRHVLLRLLALIHIEGRLCHDGIGVRVLLHDLQNLLRRSAHAAKIALVCKSVGYSDPILFVVHKAHAPTSIV